MENEKLTNEVKNDVVFVVSNNDEILSLVQKHSSKKGIKVICLPEQMVENYQQIFGKNDVESTNQKLIRFLREAENKSLAKMQCDKLFNLLNKNHEIKTSFKRSDITKFTNLSNKQASEILYTLNLFGFIKFTKGTHEFQFLLETEDVLNSIFIDLKKAVDQLNFEIERYLLPINKSEFSEEEIQEMLKKAKKDILKLLKF